MAKIPVSRWLLLAVLAAAVAFAVVALSTAFLLPSASRPVVQVAAYGLLIAVALLLFFWLLWKVAHLFLWRVSRRLAFSYFLIGFLPIPMVLLLLFLNAYLLAGYFLGHRYRDAVHEIHQELSQAASSRLAATEHETWDSQRHQERFLFAYYRNGRRVSGDKRLPRHWPTWLTETEGEEPFTFVALSDGSPTLAAAATGKERGVLVILEDDVEQTLRNRSGVWVSLLRADDPRKENVTRLSLGGKEYSLLPLKPNRGFEGREEFFGTPPEGLPRLERPFIWWGEIAGPLRDLEDGSTLSEYMAASLNGNLPIIYSHLFSSSAEVNTSVWASLIAITGLLASIYGVAIAMAFYMIFTLSRSVNSLSRATNAVRQGEFAVRIPVRRRDQMGELQGSFNEMAANLEQSVLAIAQKEILENELKIARDLQQSLLPTDLPASESVDFSTLFEPSAAIGGDYFDVLRLDENRIVVVIADVSGHGLSTGLRMAMLKAALVILVQEGKEPTEVFRRLSAMIRAEGEQRLFVTATLSVVDFRRGELAITNAGHPPTYLLRDGEVSEILLPGNPLGALGEDYGSRTIDLEGDDVVVWLSDGLIEATNSLDEPFGYEAVVGALEGTAASAAVVRNRLLDALKTHTDGQPAEDDKTLVVMRYMTPAAEAPTPRKE
ncbi:MAG: SpoIIE family protein phosphatase [Thermoanaerobaculia bacterium]